MKCWEDHWGPRHYLDLHISHPLVTPLSLNLLEFTQSRSLTLSLLTSSGFQIYIQALILGIFLKQSSMLTLPK